MALFPLTENDTAAIAEEARLKEELQALRKKSQGIRGYSEEDRALQESINTEFLLVEKSLNALRDSEMHLLATLKLESNKAVNGYLPGGSYQALLTFAEQTVGLLSSEDGLRTAGVIKGVILHALNAGADQDLHLAYANITAARYEALSKTNIPQELVHAIMVAEASRPWPTPSGSIKGKG